jgi:two-component system response regulator FlrC
MARALLLCDGAVITTDDLMFDQPTAQATQEKVSVNNIQVSGTLQQGAREAEFQQILDAMRVSRCRGDAATRLGISERTLRYKLQRMRQAGMDVPKVYSR